MKEVDPRTQYASIVHISKTVSFPTTMQPGPFLRARGHLFKDVGESCHKRGGDTAAGGVVTQLQHTCYGWGAGAVYTVGPPRRRRW